MNIEIYDCNSILFGNIEILKNQFNLKYGVNGTGKTTIIKAIESTVKHDDKALASLKPFRYQKKEYKDCHNPTVKGIDEVDSVLIFNDEYASNFVFKQDKNSEAIVNSFSILVKPKGYDEKISTINNLVAKVRNTFEENDDLKDLISKLDIFIDGFGRAKTYSTGAKLVKGFTAGNTIDNVPDDVSDYSFYIQNAKDNDNVSWINWMHQGDNG